MGGPFMGRTIQLVQDLSSDEQRYFYQKARLYKEAITNRDYDFINAHIIDDNNFSAYLLFQENSTRTKESFYNACRFHKVRTKDLSVGESSILKNETLTDTVKMLMGYAEHSCFIIRSSVEGVCRWLESALQKYAEQSGMMSPFCINAGDGSNEHPTQEFLDEFTFHEYYHGDTSHIHIALIGDLLHGRTVHSKCDGLQIFDEVRVDLIAPEEIGFPKHYIKEMESQGFEVRKFESLEEYIEEKNQADIWYFTRLQRERVADNLVPSLERIRYKISLQDDFLSKIKDEVKFYHPLPRDKLYPTIPFSIDDTPYNGWNQQAVNGYYARITLLAMLKGVIGDDFEGQTLQKAETLTEFMFEKEVNLNKAHEKPVYKIGIKPVENGIVIDHIASGMDIAQIWDRINLIRNIMKFNTISSHGVYKSHRTDEYKGIISLPDFELTENIQFKKLGAVSPGCTINIIKNSTVIKKMKITLPPRIYNFKEITCRNPRCISFVDNYEQVSANFYRKGDEYFCRYCKTPHMVSEIWDTSSLR